MSGPWDKYKSAKPWEKYQGGPAEPEMVPETDIINTAIDKLAQGATGGMADEISGGMEALGQAAGVAGLGGKISDIGWSDHGPTADWQVLKHAYMSARDKDRKLLKQESEDHPIISGATELAGGVVSPINKILPGSAVKAGLALGGINGFGNSDAGNALDLAKDTVFGGGLGAGAGLLADKVIAPALGKTSKFLGSKLQDSAESLAENATGATGAQASKFQDGAGRELLDRKLVRFGDSPANVADRVSGAVENANSQIDSSLAALDAKGAMASADNVVAGLQEKIALLKKDPSQAGLVRKLQGIVEDITATGESKVPLSAGEQTKRGYRKAAGNWMDPDAGAAGKNAYLGYMNEVENAATNADPSLAAKFKEGKETFGLLAPIEEAAEKRASTLRQSPHGGLGDMAAAAAGGGVFGIPGAVGSVIAKKVLAPRLSSSLAVTADSISKKLLQSPQMAQLAQNNPAAFQALVHKLENQAGVFDGSLEKLIPRAADGDHDAGDFNESMNKEALLQKTQGSKYGQVLQNAAKSGDQSFAAAHYVLSQRDPEYRKVTEDEN